MGQKINDNQFNHGTKVLWSGVYYMSAAQTVTLSEPISEQVNGVVLVWSRYNGTTEFNDSWNYTYVPKYHAQNFSGTGVVCPLYQGTGAAAQKYVYIADTTIGGHAINSTSPNNAQVLRFVLGV